MANTGTSGRYIYTGTTTGIAGLEIEVVDLDAIPFEKTLGCGTTDANGQFSITYPPKSYRNLYDWNPDIVVRAYDPYKRLVHETAEYKDVKDAILTLPDIELHLNNVEGWLVTNALINPAGTPVMLTTGNSIDFLIDNEVAWAEITDAVAAASVSINFMILYFEVPSVITKFTSNPLQGTRVTGEKLQDRLREAAVERSIPVRVLANDFVMPQFNIPILDSALDIDIFFLFSPVQVRRYRTLPLASMHAKLLIIDGSTAYLIGSPIMQEYWDALYHSIDDFRRGSMGITNTIKVPIHEVSTRVRGPSVEHIDRTFTDYWRQANPLGGRVPPATGQAVQTGVNVAACQVVRTLPGLPPPWPPWLEPPPPPLPLPLPPPPPLPLPLPLPLPPLPADTDPGETGILEAYQRAIANAEDFIYIEDQYFTSSEIVDAIVLRLEKHKKLEAILVLNIKVDIPGYSAIQPRTIRQLLEGVDKVNATNRLGIFTTWSHEAGTPTGKPTRIMRNYIHSKTAIVDDKWATVGSANTDGVSMNQVQIQPWDINLTNIVSERRQSRPTQHANPNILVQPIRAVELNLAIYNGVAGQPATPIIDDLRRRLWREHLGYVSTTDEALMTRPTDGWLKLWRERASFKLDGLKLPTPEVREPRVLEWAMPSDEFAYLSALGVDVTRLRVLTKVRSFDFDKGKWDREM